MFELFEIWISMYLWFFFSLNVSKRKNTTISAGPSINEHLFLMIACHVYKVYEITHPNF